MDGGPRGRWRRRRHPGAPYEYTALDLLNAAPRPGRSSGGGQPPGGEEDEDQDDDQDDDRNDDRNDDEDGVSSDVADRNEDASSSSSSSSARRLVAAARRLSSSRGAEAAPSAPPGLRAPASEPSRRVVDSWVAPPGERFTLLASAPPRRWRASRPGRRGSGARTRAALLRSPRVPRESDAAAPAEAAVQEARAAPSTAAGERAGTGVGEEGTGGRRDAAGGGRRAERAADEVSADALGTPIRRPRGPTRGFERDASKPLPSPSGGFFRPFEKETRSRFGPLITRSTLRGEGYKCFHLLPSPQCKLARRPHGAGNPAAICPGTVPQPGKASAGRRSRLRSGATPDSGGGVAPAPHLHPSHGWSNLSPSRLEPLFLARTRASFLSPDSQSLGTSPESKRLPSPDSSASRATLRSAPLCASNTTA